MIQTTVNIKFLTPCLGNVRKPDYDRFERSGTGAVTFLQSWWRETLSYGARALGKFQDSVLQTRIHPHIVGEVRRYKRYYNANQFTEHEAFLTDDVVSINAIIPDGMTEEDFKQILKLAGNYKGISPYGWREGYGRFTVV